MLRWFRRENGQQMILIALALPVLLGFIGLGVDLGLVYSRYRHAQNAADSAASAAVVILYQSKLQAAQDEAMKFAQANGFDAAHVTVNYPWRGPYANDPRRTQFVQVQITDEVKPIFSGFIRHAPFNLTVVATAGYKGAPLDASFIVLQPHGTSVTGNGQKAFIKVNDGTSYINSDSSSAVGLGNSDLIARQNFIVGGGSGGTISPAFTKVPTPIEDPLRKLPVPSGCPTIKSEPMPGQPYKPGHYTFVPTNFNHVFDGDAGNQPDSDPCKGVFWFDGDFSLKAGDSLTVNHGMFYFATGGLSMKGHPSFTGTSPTSGPYAGIFIFMAHGNSSMIDMRGTPYTGASNCDNAETKGIIYLPDGTLSMKGTSDTYACSAVVVYHFAFNGNCSLTIDAYHDQISPYVVSTSQVE
jgi:Flp pilus assembly protein TadG